MICIRRNGWTMRVWKTDEGVAALAEHQRGDTVELPVAEGSRALQAAMTRLEKAVAEFEASLQVTEERL